MRVTDQALWIGLAGVLASTGVFLALRESDNETLYILLSLLALLAPLALVAWLIPKIKPQDWLGELPPALDIVLATLAGVSVWGAGWWLMNIANDELYRRVGLYVPTLARLELWSVEVSYFVVLIPLATALLIFGAMRAVLSTQRFSLLYLTLYFAVLAVLTTPQGLVAVLGYGLLGGIAAFLSLQTRSLLMGFAPYAGFMYMNLAFLDELALELGGVPYSDTRWLTLVLFSLFITLVLVQAIRFRHVKSAPASTEAPTVLGYLALVLLLLAMMFITLGELQRRNEYSGLIQTIDPDITSFAT